MARKFEKISLKQFKKDINQTKEDYDNYKLPERSTKNSAGYDFMALENFILKPNETKKIPLGIKAQMNSDEMLMMFVRSSQGFKYNIRLCNQVGIIDCDYYNNIENEGHIWIRIQNEGEKDYIVNKGDKICQGIFVKYLTVDDEKGEKKERKGGFGSTTKGEKNDR